MDEIKNPVSKGGLELPCIATMSKSLLLRQLLRLLDSDDCKSINHISFWIGEVLSEFCDKIIDGVHPAVVPAFFENLAELAAQAMISEIFTADTWNKTTNKMIYNCHATNFSVPRVELIADTNYNFKDAWKRLSLPVLSFEAKEALYLIMHNKLNVKERLFRIGSAADPYCDFCFDLVGAVFSDIEHYFCQCQRVREVWEDVLAVLVQMEPKIADLSNWEIITLKLMKSSWENEIVWLVGSYLSETWKLLSLKGEIFLSREKVFGFLKFKYRIDQVGARYKFRHISALV